MADVRRAVVTERGRHTKTSRICPKERICFPSVAIRFNVVFLFGGRIYFLADKIKDFLQNVHGPANGLLKAVLADVKVPLYLAGCKVLGIINKCISTPLWRETENKGHILKLCYVIIITLKNSSLYMF